MQTLVPWLPVASAPPTPAAGAIAQRDDAAAFAALFLLDVPAGETILMQGNAPPLAPEDTLIVPASAFAELEEAPVTPLDAVMPQLCVIAPLRFPVQPVAAGVGGTPPDVIAPSVSRSFRNNDPETPAVSAGLPVVQARVAEPDAQISFAAPDRAERVLSSDLPGGLMLPIAQVHAPIQTPVVPVVSGTPAPMMQTQLVRDVPATTADTIPADVIAQMPVRSEGAALVAVAPVLGERALSSGAPVAKAVIAGAPLRPVPQTSGQVIQTEIPVDTSERLAPVFQSATEMVIRAQTGPAEGPMVPSSERSGLQVRQAAIVVAKTQPDLPETAQVALTEAPFRLREQGPRIADEPLVRPALQAGEVRLRGVLPGEILPLADRERVADAILGGLGPETGFAQQMLPVVAMRADGPGPVAAPPVPVAMLPQMIVAAVQSGSVEPTGLRLDPVELGSVSFSIDMQATGLVVTIIAERPETVDLLRRHAEQFLSDLRQSGFQGASLQFGPSDQSGQGQTRREMPQEPGETATPAPPPRFEQQPQLPRRRAAAGGLDMRL